MKNNFRHILNEGSRDNMLAAYLPLFQKRGIETNLSQLKQFLLAKFVNEAGIRQLSERSNYYLAGVARYYFNGDLTENKRLNALYPNVKDRFIKDVCVRLNAIISILRVAYIDSVGTKFEQPEDFGTLKITQLFRKYNKKVNELLGITDGSEAVEEKTYDNTVNGNYTYDVLHSYEEATKYNRYTEPGAWCITYGRQHYDAYVRRLNIHYVIFLMNGYEKVPRKVGKGFTKQKPHDLYGNSMIALLQSNSSPEPVYITSRWNHGSYQDGTEGTEADHAYTKEEFLATIGSDESILRKVFQQWKEEEAKLGRDTTSARKKQNQDKLGALRKFKYAQMLINNGTDPKELTNIFTGGYLISGTMEKYKGVFLMTVDSGGRRYITIMDRKKLMFDQYLEECECNPRNMVSAESNFITMRNYNRTRSMIYLTNLHRFLEIDGVTKFKYISGHLDYGNDDKLSFVAVSTNQMAMIDSSTMKVLSPGNGRFWFESIIEYTSYRDSNTDWSGRNFRFPSFWSDTFLKLTYDSSSGEKYFFSTASMTFVDPPKETEDGFRLNERQNGQIKGYFEYIKADVRTTEGGQTYNSFTERFYDPNEKKWLNLNGVYDFNQMILQSSSKGYGVFSYIPKGDNQWHYFYRNGWKNIMLGDSELRTEKKLDMRQVADYITFIVKSLKAPSGRWISERLLYNPFTGSIYHDNISGYKFYIDKVSEEGLVIWKPEAVEDGVIPSYGDASYNGLEEYVYRIPLASSAVEGVKEDKRREFNLIMENMSKYFK